MERRLWYVCPKCGKKLIKFRPGGAAHGVYLRCSHCKSDIEIKIETKTEHK